MDPYWYRTFFDGVTVDWWRSVATPEWTRADVDLAWKELRLDGDSRVLDCPCGTGRHAIELARRGCHVTGIDISAYSLNLARRDSTDAGIAVDFREGDMLDLSPISEVDAALTLGNSFGYLDHAGTTRFVQSVAATLTPGGRWLIDSGAVAESILPTMKPALDYENDGISVHIANNYLTAESCLETTFEFTHAGQTETRRTWQFVFTVAEIRRMLAAAGLNTIALYGWGGGEPYSLGSRGLCLVAEKQQSAN